MIHSRSHEQGSSLFRVPAVALPCTATLDYRHAFGRILDGGDRHVALRVCIR